MFFFFSDRNSSFVKLKMGEDWKAHIDKSYKGWKKSEIHGGLKNYFNTVPILFLPKEVKMFRSCSIPEETVFKATESCMDESQLAMAPT